MSGLNLRWWRKRPSVHVAESSFLESRYIVNLDPILYDMDVSWIAKLSGLRDITIAGDKRGRFQAGTHVQYEGKHYKVEAVEKRDPDDWFSDELTVTLRDPVAAANPTRYVWNEDEFMPRVDRIA